MRDFQLPGRSMALATNGMCATSHPLAAKVAVQMLEAGGNAVDAAIAGAVVLGLCEPAMTGIGGDCFALVSPAGTDDVVAINGSGRAPAGLNPDHIRAAGHTSIPIDGPEAITIPGAVDAFCQMAADYGKLGLAASLAPAIYYAEAGVPVAPRAASDWALHHGRLKGVARQHYLINGAGPTTGQLFRAPGQADVLRRIALDGPQAFYEGEVAEDMVKALTAIGGTHTLADFAGTGPIMAPPSRASMAGWSYWSIRRTDRAPWRSCF